MKVPFEKLELQLKAQLQLSDGNYKVYKDSREFIVVEASIASEAIEKSGITSPYKVERLNLKLRDVLDASEILGVVADDSGSRVEESNVEVE